MDSPSLPASPGQHHQLKLVGAEGETWGWGEAGESGEGTLRGKENPPTQISLLPPAPAPLRTLDPHSLAPHPSPGLLGTVPGKQSEKGKLTAQPLPLLTAATSWAGQVATTKSGDAGEL